jgi:hypothetical protein
MPIEPPREGGAFGPEETAAMAEAFDVRAMNFAPSASFKWCANSSLNELLRQHRKASLTRVIYGRSR